MKSFLFIFFLSIYFGTATAKPQQMVQGFLIKIESNIVYAYSNDSQIKIKKSELSKIALKKINRSAGKEFSIYVNPKSILEIKKMKPNKSIQRMISRHKKYKIKQLRRKGL